MLITKELKDSAILKFSVLAREKNKNKEKIISLGLGEPSFDTPLPIIEATTKALVAGYTKYSHPLGLMELRQAISDKFLGDNKIETSPDNIIITPGAKQALSLALMALLEPHDEVINITPCYVSYIPQVKIAEPTAVIHNIDLKKEDLSIDWERMEKTINSKTKVIILNFPHNPTGQMLSGNDMERLVEIVLRHKCYIISDEIYEKLVFSDVCFCSIGSFKALKDRVITINGFSKAYSMTGWRIGYLAAHSQIIRIISKLQQHMNTNTCTFVQKGACASFSLDPDYLNFYIKQLKTNVDAMIDTLKANSKIHLIAPKGGLFSFINISKAGLKSDEFAYKLLAKKNVALTPGISFGDNWDDHVRISLATGSDDFKEGMELIDEFVRGL